MAKILIGTSGYYYKDWIGKFYPPKTEQKNFSIFIVNVSLFVSLILVTTKCHLKAI